MSKQRLVRIIKAVFNREVIVYVIVGVLTTLVNLIVFTVLCAIFGNDQWWISKAPAILAAILFAYYMNRVFVFRSHGPVLQELWKFFTSRILISLLFEYGGNFLLYDVLGWKDAIHFRPGDQGLMWANLATQVLVIVGNYLISKFFIFIHREPVAKRDPHEL